MIGDFTWTGWDYLGEVGIGRVAYGDDGGLLMGDYPWLAAWCADIDITGGRRPLSYLREIVFGLRSEPYVSVQDPARHGLTPTHQGLAGEPWLEGLASWSWPGCRGPADHGRRAERRRRGGVAGERHFRRPPTRRPGTRVPHGLRHDLRAGRDRRHRLPRRSGGRADVTDVGKRSRSVLDVRVDREQIRADDTDLAFVEITLVHDDGTLCHTADRAVTVAIDGPGELLGFGSADPCTEATFGVPTHDTFRGRALAVVRPTGAGIITVTVSAADCGDRRVTIAAHATLR